MRVEANISVSPVEGELGTKVEVKNINSFKAVESAIEYEIARHTKALDAGERLQQETRGWDENKSITFAQRSKETAKDYRYFPDPDIPKVLVSAVSEYSADILSEKISVLPNDKRVLLESWNISEQITEVIISDRELDRLFMTTAELLRVDSEDLIGLLANYVAVDLKALRSSNGELKLAALEPPSLAELIELVGSKKVGSRGAKDLLPKLFGYKGSVLELAEKEGVMQNSNPEAIKGLVQQVLSENPSQVAELKSGKEAVLKYLVGQGMKLSKGAADPAVLESVILGEINN